MEKSAILSNGRENGNGKKTTLLDVQKHLIQTFITGAISAVIIGIIFYFNTNSTLDAHTIKFNEMERRLSKSEEKIELLTTEVTAVKIEIREIKESQKQMREDLKDMQADLKKIYDLILTIKNK